MKTFSATLIFILAGYTSISQGIVEPVEQKTEAPTPPACRDPRFRMVPDCESLVFVEKVNINGEDRDVVYNRKSNAPYSGQCKVCHNNGNLWMFLQYEGGWSYGIDTVYYENGNINLIRSHDTQGLGKEDGTWKFYREDGTLKWEKTFVMGAADGEQRYYYPDSTLEKVEMWKMGQLNGQKQEFYPGGKIRKEIGYKDGKFDGTYRTFYENGNVESEQQYVNDKKTGPSAYYYESGQLFYSENHENGLREGEIKRFYMTGRKWTVENYKNDMRHGVFEEYYDDEKNTMKYSAIYKKDVLVEEHYYNEFGEEVAAPTDGNATPTEGEGTTEGEEGGEGKKGKKEKKNKKD